MEQAKINRINELAKKKKEYGLTAAEEEEQQALRQEYIASVKRNTRAALEQLRVPPKKQERKQGL